MKLRPIAAALPLLSTMAALSLAGTIFAPAAQAETVVERAARTGVITIGTRTNLIPYAYVDGKQQLVGASVDVAERIAREVSNYLQKPVRLEFRPVEKNDALYRMVNQGEVDFACGIPFTWQQEMVVDYSVPFSLSGIRLLTKGNESRARGPGGQAHRRDPGLPGGGHHPHPAAGGLAPTPEGSGNRGGRGDQWPPGCDGW